MNTSVRQNRLTHRFQLLSSTISPNKLSPLISMAIFCTCTMAMGGLRDYTCIEDAWKWIAGGLWTAYGPQPCTIYSKGKDFKSIAYVKFGNKQDRDATMRVFEIVKKKEGGSHVWAKEDRPLNTQALHSFCYGLRWQLGEWGYPKQAYEIEEETWTFHARGIEVLQADLKDGQLEIE